MILWPLTSLVRQCYEESKINEIICGNIKDEINPKSLITFTTIAYRCLKKDREERPLMTEVVSKLGSALEYQVMTEGVEPHVSSAVKPMERQHEDGVDEGGPCLINEARADNIRKNNNLDVKLVDTSGIGYYPSSMTHSEGISLDEVKWEIQWEDLVIGERIDVGCCCEEVHEPKYLRGCTDSI